MEKTYIIAEIGVNHNGDLNLAKNMIDAASESGADAVKFQTYKTELLVSENTEKAQYQKDNCPDASESQFQMLKKLELDEKSHYELLDYANSKGMDFISTPFDMQSAEFLINDLQVPTIKIPSGEIVNGPLLYRISKAGLPIILSTGMANEEEIRMALNIIGQGMSEQTGYPSPDTHLNDDQIELVKDKVTLLLCTTAYPTPVEDVNLMAMENMEKIYGTRVGISDHTEGVAVSVAAVARGACLVEKHFTLDKSMPGPDHKASLVPDEFKRLVDEIRIVERAMGDPVKKSNPSEIPNITIARQGLISSCDIKKGEMFSEKNLTSRRPATGVSPMKYWSLIGTEAKRSYKEGEPIVDE